MGGIELAVVTGALFPNLPLIVVSASAWKYHGYRDNYPNIKYWIEEPFKPSTLIGLAAGAIAENANPETTLE